MTLKVEPKNYEYTTNKNVASKKTEAPNSIWKTNINGEIEDTEQGKTGDCWLLTNLNCLRDTKWGKQIIKNAIQPDGKGGAIITFKGAKTKAKKFHITAAAIVQARKSGIYSKGDDDVIAMELAVERYLKIYTNQEHLKPGQAIDGSSTGPADFVELLTGKRPNEHYIFPPQSNKLSEGEKSYNEKRRVLEEIEKHPEEYAVMVGFQGDSIDGVMLGQHAYQLQKVITKNNKKYVVLVNPHHSSEKIEMEMDKFIYYSNDIRITEAPGVKQNNNIKSDLERKRDFLELQLYIMNVKNSDDAKKLDIDKVKYLIELVDENNIEDLFQNKDFIYIVITVLDLLKSGWGNGKEKKALIAPLVDSYCKHAKKQGAPEDIIQKIKTDCYKELDATFYTNEKAIIENLQMLFDEIEKAKENNPLNKIFGSKLKNLSFGL